MGDITSFPLWRILISSNFNFELLHEYKKSICKRKFFIKGLQVASKLKTTNCEYFSLSDYVIISFLCSYNVLAKVMEAKGVLTNRLCICLKKKRDGIVKRFLPENCFYSVIWAEIFANKMGFGNKQMHFRLFPE